MWKDIPGYEGFYQASDEGLIRSVTRCIKTKRGVLRRLDGHIMKLTETHNKDNPHGWYLVCNLQKEGSIKLWAIHTLIAMTFIPNPYNYPMVNHKDGNKQNNRVENLEWVTAKMNSQHAYATGLSKPIRNPIACFTKDGSLVGEYESIKDASRKTGLGYDGIYHCIVGDTRTGHGYIWKRKSECETTIPTGSTPEDELPAEAQRAS